jgi:hypothetical protein
LTGVGSSPETLLPNIAQSPNTTAKALAANPPFRINKVRINKVYTAPSVSLGNPAKIRRQAEISAIHCISLSS